LRQTLVRFFVLAGTVSLLLVTTAGLAGAAKPLVTLTFDELPTQPVNGLSFRGITFGFEVAGTGSTDARYNGGGPSAATVAEVPCLEGNAAGELTLRFDKPTNILRFGVVLSREGTFTPGFSVELFSPGGRSRGITDVTTTPTPVSRFGWSEGTFDYQGAAVGTAVITFNLSFDPESGSRFALDNLTFKRIK
jgi:hypothetical protein